MQAVTQGQHPHHLLGLGSQDDRLGQRLTAAAVVTKGPATRRVGEQAFGSRQRLQLAQCLRWQLRSRADS